MIEAPDSILVFVLLPRFLDDLLGRNKKHWLFTNEEIDLAAERYGSYNTQGEKIRFGQIWATFKDIKTYLFALRQGASVLSIYVVGSFLPTFITNFGLTPLNTQLFTIVPYTCALFCILFAGFMSDYWNTRGPFLMAGLPVSCTVYILLLSITHSVISVIAACLLTSGCYTSTIILPIWIAINTGKLTKRSTSWAFAELVGLCFSIMGTRIYTNPPRFVKGHSVVLSLNAVALLSSITAYFVMSYRNKKKDRIQAEYAVRGELHPHIATNATLEEVYDEHISFRYIL